MDPTHLTLGASSRDGSFAPDLRAFEDVRSDALAAWESGRIDETGEPWECRWQAASEALPHDECGAQGCGSTHVSLYCSFNDSAEQIVDLLTDERLDDYPMGVDAVGVLWPSGHGLDPDTLTLFRFYVRVLWASGVVLDDLEGILKLADQQDLRPKLSAGAPLDVGKLQAFINHVAKHGAKSPASLHRWNQHGMILFEDSGFPTAVLDGLTGLTAQGIPASPDALVLPRLEDVVGTVCAALRNADVLMDDSLLRPLAARFGTCD